MDRKLRLMGSQHQEEALKQHARHADEIYVFESKIKQLEEELREKKEEISELEEAFGQVLVRPSLLPPTSPPPFLPLLLFLFAPPLPPLLSLLFPTDVAASPLTNPPRHLSLSSAARRLILWIT